MVTAQAHTPVVVVVVVVAHVQAVVVVDARMVVVAQVAVPGTPGRKYR